jgi:HSP20 family protein
MKLARLDPISLFRDFDRFFEAGNLSESLTDVESADWHPRVDVSDRDDSIFIRAEVPGVDPKEVDITLDGKIITIKGSKKLETEEDTNGFRRREIFEGSFRRSIRLPFVVDPDSVVASATNGILEITIPKAEEASPRKIAVTVD